MTPEELRGRQAPFKEQYRSDPASARDTLTARGELRIPDLAVDIKTNRGPITHAGLHPMAGGDGTWTCAAEMLLESLIGCVGVTFGAVATAMSVPVTRGYITAEGDLDFRGTLGIDRQTPVGFQAIRLIFELETIADEAQLTKLMELSERYCVVAQSLSEAARPKISFRRLSSRESVT